MKLGFNGPDPRIKKQEEMTAEDKAINARMNPSNQRQWIAALDAVRHKLNAWESNFVTSMGNNNRQGRLLSPTEAKKLEDLYAEKT